ncbi:unnamed protein product [Musa acuminata var. zebrina]
MARRRRWWLRREGAVEVVGGCVWRTYLYCKCEDERERRGRLFFFFFQVQVFESLNEFLSLLRNGVIYCVMMLLEQSQDFAAEILDHMV